MFYPKRSKYVIIGLLLFSLALAACGEEPVEVTRVVEVEVPGPEVTREVEVEVPGPEVEVTRVVEVMLEGAVDTVPFEEMWANSPHNAVEDEAFIHWNEDDPQEVPPTCARCHSTPGYLDWIGADGSEAGVVDAPAPIGTTVECAACHNDVTVVMDSVVFPSGVEVTGLGDEARCMQCHQGRHSTVSVNQSIADAGLTEDVDAVSEDLGFSNIHYYAAAATQYGTIAKGGYEYDGKTYDYRNDHVPGYDTCIGCHDPHTLEVKVEECSACHTNINTVEELVDIRMPGSLVDYDGDGDMSEGIYYEIDGMRDVLFQAMQAYAIEVAGGAIVYNEASHPYFFTDADGDGQASEGDESYASWTARLAKAAYNYQVSLKDPGRFAHGGKYILQLLYDSIEDLNGGLSSPVDINALQRIDHGHFAGSEEAFRHWDVEGGIVPGSCSRCHSAAGLPLFIEQGVTINQPVANGLECATCHNDLTTFTRYETEEVPFPSGVSLTTGNLDSNLCINCHQGRESTVSVNQRIGDLGDDTVSESLRFVNIHYFAAGASLFGTQAKGAYEYTGQVYNGRNEHIGAFDSCIECHNSHALEVEVAECAECHEGVATREDLRNIRMSEVDFDGDGDVTEGIAGEIETMHEALLAGLQEYAASIEGTANIGYTTAAYPYFYIDVNGDGMIDAEEVSDRENQYNTWTPHLLRAAYNYQYIAKDPGAFAHNGHYIIQVLYDSLTNIGADTSGMTRP